jgi:hypothetical protein
VTGGIPLNSAEIFDKVHGTIEDQRDVGIVHCVDDV